MCMPANRLGWCQPTESTTFFEIRKKHSSCQYWLLKLISLLFDKITPMSLFWICDVHNTAKCSKSGVAYIGTHQNNTWTVFVEPAWENYSQQLRFPCWVFNWLDWTVRAVYGWLPPLNVLVLCHSSAPSQLSWLTQVSLSTNLQK